VRLLLGTLRCKDVSWIAIFAHTNAYNLRSSRFKQEISRALDGEAFILEVVYYKDFLLFCATLVVFI
jgi:hypothetical protein